MAFGAFAAEGGVWCQTGPQIQREVGGEDGARRFEEGAKGASLLRSLASSSCEASESAHVMLGPGCSGPLTQNYSFKILCP